MELKEVINQNAVAVDLDAADKEEAFTSISRMLLADGSIVSAEEFKQALYEREALGETGIGNGIAIPHGKSNAVRKTCISVVKLKRPIIWESLDQKPVEVLILFAVSLEDKNNYFLKLMAQIAKKLAWEDTCRKLKASTTPEELIAVLTE